MPVNCRDPIGEEPAGLRDQHGICGLPRLDELNEFRVERYVTVVAEFPDWDMEPMVVTDADDWISGEVGEFPDPHPGPRQQKHTELAERVRFDVGLVHELGHVGVVEKLR
jgi:hypothetical protein